MSATSAVVLPFPKYAAVAATHFVLDDFERADGVSCIGTRWSGFSDRVMGGRSNATAKYDVIDARRCLRMTGRVNTNGGGFVQLALDLELNAAPLDASRFAGVEIDIWGNGEDYNCHLRTIDVRWYEQSYRATMCSRPQWSTVRLPWSSFVPHGLNKPINTKGLLRLGVLGWMRDFEADYAVGRVALFAELPD